MALDTSKISLKTNILVHVKLDSGTQYYADRHIAMDDGFWYDGRAKIGGRMSERLQGLIEPRQLSSTFRVTFDNADGGLNTLLSNNVWGRREVVIYAGEGTTLSEYSIVFVGYVQYPNGITRTGDSVAVMLIDAIKRDKLNIPSAIYANSVFPDLDPIFAGVYRPIMYGDFTASPTQTTKAVCIDTVTANGQKVMEAAGHELGGISQVYRNGVEVGFSMLTLDPARYTITNYDAGIDVITNRCFGKPGLGVDLAGSTQMTHPVDQLYDFMINEAGIPAARVDKASFVAVKNIDTSQVARRFIDKTRDSTTTIAELSNEFSYDMFMVGGCYTLQFRDPGGANGQILDTSDYITGTLKAVEDPELTTTNKIQYFSNYDPVNQNFNAAETRDGLTAMVAAGATIEREMHMYWQYSTVHADARAARELMTFGSAPEIVSADFTIRSMLLSLTGDVVVTLPGYVDTNMQVRGMGKDWNKLNNKLTLWNVPSFLDVGRYTSDDAPFLYGANTQQQQDQGFWLNADSTVGVCYLNDVFTDTDGVLLPAHPMTIGPYWDDVYGSMQIQSNAAAIKTRASLPAGILNGSMSVVGTTLTAYTYTASAQVVGSTGVAGMVFRYVDANNFQTIYFSRTFGVFFLYSVVNGLTPGDGQQFDVLNPGSSPFEMKVEVTDAGWDFYLNGVHSTTLSGGPNPFQTSKKYNAEGTKIGMWTKNDDDSFHSLVLDPVDVGTPHSNWY